MCEESANGHFVKRLRASFKNISLCTKTTIQGDEGLFMGLDSTSYSSPVVCVRKRDGSLRLCIDYRELNSKTNPDRHRIPRVQDVMDSLGGIPSSRYWTRVRHTTRDSCPKIADI